MSFVFNTRVRAAFAPPRYLARSLAGIDLSTSGVKAVRLAESARGLILATHAEERLPPGAFIDGEIVDHVAVTETLAVVARAAGIRSANVALSESKSFLFETTVQGATMDEWRIGVEQHLDELVPLPPQEIVFDMVEVGSGERGTARIAGVGLARRIVDNTLAVFDQAHIGVQVLEEETFAMARALLPHGDTSTTLIIDIGRTTTKMVIVAGRIPRFAATVGIGGHALTLAVQKYFGITEAEARRVKAERGMSPCQEMRIISRPCFRRFLRYAMRLHIVSNIGKEKRRQNQLMSQCRAPFWSAAMRQYADFPNILKIPCEFPSLPETYSPISSLAMRGFRQSTTPSRLHTRPQSVSRCMTINRMYNERTNLLPEERQRILRHGYFLRLGVVIIICISGLICAAALLLLPMYIFLTKMLTRKKHASQILNRFFFSRRGITFRTAFGAFR